MQDVCKKNYDIVATGIFYLCYGVLVLEYPYAIGAVRLFWILFNGSLLRLCWEAENRSKELSHRVSYTSLAFLAAVTLSAPLMFKETPLKSVLFLLQSLLALSLLGYCIAIHAFSRMRIF